MENTLKQSGQRPSFLARSQVSYADIVRRGAKCRTIQSKVVNLRPLEDAFPPLPSQVDYTDLPALEACDEHFSASELTGLITLRVERIFIVEIDSDEDVPSTPTLPRNEDWCNDYFSSSTLEEIVAPPLSFQQVRMMKLRRKWTLRWLRRCDARFNRWYDTYLLDEAIRANMPEVQSGTVRPIPLVTRNILALQAKGALKHEISDLMRGKAFDKILFSKKQLSRIYRDILQIRSAIARLEAARSEEQRRYEKVKQKRAIAIERATKYADTTTTQGLGDVISVALKVCSTVSSIATMVSLVKSTKKVERRAVNLLDTIVDKFKDFADYLSSYGPVIKAVFVALVVYYLWQQFPSPVVRACVLGIVPIVFVGKIKTFLTEFFQKVEAPDISLPELQGVASDTILPNMLATLVLLAVGVKGKPNIFNGAVEAIRKLSPLSKGIDCLLDFGSKAIECVVNVVMRWLKRPEIKFRRKMELMVDEAVKKAWALDAVMVEGKYEKSASLQQYTKCMECNHQLTRLIAMYHDDVKIRMELVQIRNIMVGHCAKLRSTMGNGTGFRPEPVSVLLESDPGKGKTMQIPILVATLLKESGLMPDLTRDTMQQAYFTRPPNSSFFDGYYGQPAYYVDDVWQRKRAISDVSEFDDIMSFYGTVTTMLNMAECEKKGMFPFTSSLLLMTTNATSFKSIGADAFLLQPEALRRRIDFHYHIDVREEFQIKSGKNIGQLDFNKYRIEKQRLIDAGKTGRDVHPWHIWEMWETDFQEEKPIYKSGTGQDFSLLVGMVIDAIKYKRESHEENMDHLDLILQAGDVYVSACSEPDGTVLHHDEEAVISEYDDMPGLVHEPRSHAVAVHDSVSGIAGDLLSQSSKSIEDACARLLDFHDSSDGLVSLGHGDTRPIDNNQRYERYATDIDFDSIDKFVADRGNKIDFSPKELSHAVQKFTPVLNTDDDRPLIDFPVNPCHSTDVKVDGKKRFNCNPRRMQLNIVRMYLLCAAAAYFCTLYVSIRFFWYPVVNAMWAGVKSVISHFLGKKPEGTEVQSNGPQVKTLVYRPPPPVSQGPGSDGLWDNIYGNTFKMLVEVDDKNLRPFGQVLFLGGNVAVMPHHFITDLHEMLSSNVISKNSIILFRGCGPSYLGIRIPVDSFLSYPNAPRPDHDLHFINFKRGFRMMPNIISKIMLERDAASLGGRQVRLDVACVDSDGQLIDYCQRLTYITPSVSYYDSPLYTQDGRKFPRYFQYQAATKRGDCGAPLSVCDYRHYNNRCLMGLHVAGRADGFAFATPITQEMCQKVFDSFKVVERPEASHVQSGWNPDIEITPIDSIPFVQSGDIGNLKPMYTTSIAISNPVKSSLVKTFIGEEELFKDEITVMNEGREPPVLIPMKMGPYKDQSGELIFPMERALEPYTTDVFVPKDNLLKVGLSVGLEDFADATVDYERRVLTKEEAVIGVPELGLKSITRSTSVGFPLCQVAKDKKHFFGSDDDLDVTTPEAVALFRELDDLIDLLKRGIRPQFVCRDFLKDEVRKLGKGARLIAGTDLRYYLLCRMYFGAFVGAVCRSNLKSGMCLGMNPFSDWADLYRKLMRPDKTGKNVWDGDFAGFDSSQMPQMLWECLYYINAWYKLAGCSEEDNMIREILFMDLVSSRHIVSYRGVANTVVEWSKSLPSGHFLTAVINSMLNKGLIGAAYVSLTGRLDFSETSASIVMGDDNVVATQDAYIDLFNQVTLAKFLKESFGMEYTAGRKGEELRPTVGIDDVIFLQRRFAKKDGRIVCPIRPESFLHSLYYVDTNDQAMTRKTLLDSAETALQELSMHDESHWQLVAPKLASIKKQLGKAPMLSIESSHDYLELVRSRVPAYI